MAHRLNKIWRSSDIELVENIDFSAIIQNKRVLRGLHLAGFKQPSPIQVEGIPKARLGFDLFIQAKSGTGKTLVFSVASLEHLSQENVLEVLILTPTREIAAQIQGVIYDISTEIPYLKCETFIGGLPIDEDIPKINGCQIAVGTPGRIKHLLEENLLNLSKVSLLIIDEADKMFIRGETLYSDVKCIMESLSHRKQIIAVSATYENGADEQIIKYMRNPKRINLSKDDLALKGVIQLFKIFEIKESAGKDRKDCFEQKFETVRKILQHVNFSQCFIFVNSRKYVQLYSEELRSFNFPASTMIGFIEQNTRLLTLERLRANKIKILVTTDLSARGIDIKDVNLVIHLDPASDLETYLHRVGRAGRYGTKGVSIALFNNGTEIERLAHYISRKKFSVYPLPNPLPKNLYKYVPPPEKADAVMQYIRFSIITPEQDKVLKEKLEESKNELDSKFEENVSSQESKSDSESDLVDSSEEENLSDIIGDSDEYETDDVPDKENISTNKEIIPNLFENGNKVDIFQSSEKKSVCDYNDNIGEERNGNIDFNTEQIEMKSFDKPTTDSTKLSESKKGESNSCSNSDSEEENKTTPPDISNGKTTNSKIENNSSLSKEEENNLFKNLNKDSFDVGVKSMTEHVKFNREQKLKPFAKESSSSPFVKNNHPFSKRTDNKSADHQSIQKNYNNFSHTCSARRKESDYSSPNTKPFPELSYTKETAPRISKKNYFKHFSAKDKKSHNERHSHYPVHCTEHLVRQNRPKFSESYCYACRTMLNAERNTLFYPSENGRYRSELLRCFQGLMYPMHHHFPSRRNIIDQGEALHRDWLKTLK